MKSKGRILLFGFLLWLSTFLAAFIIFPFKQSDPPFFETLISIFLAALTVLYGREYFKKQRPVLREALTVGFVWAFVNVMIDLPLFLYGPMKMPVINYFTDIGLTYLMIPLILSAFADRKKKAI